MNTKAEILKLRAREMQDFAAYCFVCGKTELLFDDPDNPPENGKQCQSCFEDVCNECVSLLDADLCRPCGESTVV